MRMHKYDRQFKAHFLIWSVNAEGINTATLQFNENLDGDLQSITRASFRLAEYGIDPTDSDAKIFFYDGGLLEGMILEDLVDGKKYLVKNNISWTGHYEAILILWNGV